MLVERYPGGMDPATLHLLMSVTKSVVGITVGALVGQGVIDTEALVTHYVPALYESGYAGATVRNLLDMRSGIHFSEDYLDPMAEVRVLEQAFGWAPKLLPDVPGTLRDFLLSLRQDGPHGGPFDYRSCETDVLGWVIEAATGRRFADVAAELVWSRIGAEFDANIGVDSEGSGMFDGGMSATLGDLARFGLMILRNGTSLTGDQVVPAWWVDDSFAGGPDSLRAFADSPGDNRMPGGFYRNQFWIPDAQRPGAALPRHPRPDDLRQPRCRRGGSEAVELADAAERLEAVLHGGRLRRDQRRPRRRLRSSWPAPAEPDRHDHHGRSAIDRPPPALTRMRPTLGR